MAATEEEEEVPHGPPAVSILPWLRVNLGKHSTAPLTGTDCDALQAAVQIAVLYQRCRHPEILVAFAFCVLRMQEHTRQFAYHAIALVANWEDRAEWWGKANLWDHCSFEIGDAWICKYEPRGRRRSLI